MNWTLAKISEDRTDPCWARSFENIQVRAINIGKSCAQHTGMERKCYHFVRTIVSLRACYSAVPHAADTCQARTEAPVKPLLPRLQMRLGLAVPQFPACRSGTAKHPPCTTLLYFEKANTLLRCPWEILGNLLTQSWASFVTLSPLRGRPAIRDFRSL